MTDMVGKKKGMIELSSNDENQQQQQSQEEKMKTAVVAAIAKAVVDREKAFLLPPPSACVGGGDSSLLVIPATPTSTTIVATIATAAESTVVDSTDQSSLVSNPPLSLTIDDYPIQQHHQPSAKDNNEEKGTAVSLPVTLDDTAASPVNEEEVDRNNTNSYLKETSVADESIEMNKKAVRTTTTTTTRKKMRKEVNLVKLPTFESIELASRLSAFDSFLFLVNDQQQQQQINDSTRTSSQVVSDEGEGHERSVENNVQDKNDTINTTKTRLFIDSLIQQNKDTHHWPTVLITPGMERVIDEKERQKKQKRLIPLEERTVRLIPGSIEERNVLMDRLSVFDDYLFLLSQNS